MKIIRTFKNKATGIKMAQVSLVLPFETADLIPAVAKCQGYDPDFMAFYALVNYMGAYDAPPCADQPTDEEKRAYGLEVEEPKRAIAS